MKKKLNDKIKGVSIELDKNTQLKDLNETIDEFTKETDNKYEVKVSLTFETTHSTLHLKRIRKDRKIVLEAVKENIVRESVSAVLLDIGYTGTWELEWWSNYSANTLALDNYQHGPVFFYW